MPFMFTDAEIAYITSQPLGRLATVGPDGRPHVMPVGVFYDPEAEAVVIGGHNLAASRRFRDARRGSASVPADPGLGHRHRVVRAHRPGRGVSPGRPRRRPGTPGRLMDPPG
jgi:hypothetical protein